MSWWWLLLVWPLSGQIVLLRDLGKTHQSWHANWKMRLALALLITFMAAGCAILGPFAFLAMTVELEESEK